MSPNAQQQQVCQGFTPPRQSIHIHDLFKEPHRVTPALARAYFEYRLKYLKATEGTKKRMTIKPFSKLLHQIFAAACQCPPEEPNAFPFHELAAQTLIRALFDLFWQPCWSGARTFTWMLILQSAKSADSQWSPTDYATICRIVFDMDLHALICLRYSPDNPQPGIFAICTRWPSPLPECLRIVPGESVRLWKLLTFGSCFRHFVQLKLLAFPFPCTIPLHYLFTLPLAIPVLLAMLPNFDTSAPLSVHEAFVGLHNLLQAQSTEDVTPLLQELVQLRVISLSAIQAFHAQNSNMRANCDKFNKIN